MARSPNHDNRSQKPGLGLDDFKQPDQDEGLSLDQLSQAYAQLLDKGDDPYREPPQAVDVPAGIIATEPEELLAGESESIEDGCPVSPRSILEAMLFVGHPRNEPLTSKQVASLMRGVRPAEIDDLVRELNELYVTERRPYEIVSVGSGYRLALREEFAPLRDKFHGRIREARLNQAAVDVLAIVAYNQPLTRQEVDKLRGKSSGSVLNQLVRRQLLRIDRADPNPRAARFFTTERFLDLFGLDSLSDLPRSQDLERNL